MNRKHTADYTLNLNTDIYPIMYSSNADNKYLQEKFNGW